MAQGRRSNGYETVIGLEIHVQLRTETKMFCACPNRFGGRPNSRTCPVCLGLPGALPVASGRAVDLAVRAALALGCRINGRSRFARKNYFYPDLPKGYQISQYDQPLAEDGRVDYAVDGATQSVGIVRLHLEEDAGKSIHDGMPRSPDTYVDLNRCGVPLAEIVTRPDLRRPEEADAFLGELRNILRYLDVTDASMQEGSLRCDANVSVRAAGQEALNPKTEIKNLNSFRFLRQALRHEEERQAAELDAGRPLRQETRLWDEAAGRTVPMRSKEEAHDYRYFPEPDLVALQVAPEVVDRERRALPELPLARAGRLAQEHGLPPGDAALLVEERALGDYFEAVVAAGADATLASNWIRGAVLRWLNEHGEAIGGFPVAAERFAGLLEAVADGTVSGNLASEVLAAMIDSGAPAARIIEERGLRQVSSEDDLGPVVDEVLAGHPEEVEAYRDGRHQVVGFLMGRVMAATRGKANPSLAQRLLRKRLEG